MTITPTPTVGTKMSNNNVPEMQESERPAWFVNEIKRRGRHHRYEKNPEELSEFWLGVLRAVQIDKGLGDPVAFVAWKGDCAVKDLRRKCLSQKSVAYCATCESSVSFTPRPGTSHLVCRSCGGIVEREHRLSYPDQSDSSAIGIGMFGSQGQTMSDNQFISQTQRTASRIIEKSGLEPSRQRSLLEIYSGIDVSPCKSCPYSCIGGIPLGECDGATTRIAKAWGVSAGTVGTYMRRLRETLSESGIL